MTASGYQPSPRPSFGGAAVIARDDAARHVWGDAEAGEVLDRIYVSNGHIHQLLFEIPAGRGIRDHGSTRRPVRTAGDEEIGVEVAQAEPADSLASSRRVPMYEQAAATLEAEIRSGRLGADERLLSERALAERLQVSRITIRRALAHLAEKDLVRSSDRSGWFAGPVSEGSDALVSFSEMGRQRGLAVTSRVLRCVTREARLAEAEELGVAPGSQVTDLARVRCFDGLPIASTETVVPGYLAPGLAGHDFSALSLYDTLRTRYRVLPTRARFAIQAAACEAADARHLEINPGEPVLIFTQTGQDQLGRPFELARTVYRADRYLFRGTLLAASDGSAPVIQQDPAPPT